MHLGTHTHMHMRECASVPLSLYKYVFAPSHAEIHIHRIRMYGFTFYLVSFMQCKNNVDSFRFHKVAQNLHKAMHQGVRNTDT